MQYHKKYIHKNNHPPFPLANRLINPKLSFFDIIFLIGKLLTKDIFPVQSLFSTSPSSVKILTWFYLDYSFRRNGTSLANGRNIS